MTMQISPAANSPKAAIDNEELSSRYEALIRLAELIRSHPEEKDLFQTCANVLHQVISFDGMSHFDSSPNWVQWHLLEPYNSEFEAIALKALPREETVAWWVYQNQQPLSIQCVDCDTPFPQVLKRLSRLGIRSVCALPLSTAHRKLGSLVFVSHLDNAYTTEDQPFLSLVADQIAVAMDDARAQQRLRLLLDITNRLVTKLELSDLLREIVGSIRELMKYEAVGVALPDGDDRELRRYVLDSPDQEQIASEHVPDLVKTVFRTGRPLNATKQELAADPLIPRQRNSLCLFPLISRDRVLGVFGVGSSRENAVIDDDLTFLGEVANRIALAVENALAYKQVSELKDQLAQENVYLESEIRSELHFEEIVGKSEQLLRALKEVETVAPTDSTVLIYGETGTGKELIARAVHNLSSRKSNAFVKLNCAAIPTGLLESELFGHEKGAFTGAITQRVGRFELANRGTIFLDEVGEIPLELQPKLLRVLQEREFERLGSTRTLHADARLIAATNRDLSAMVEQQKFRSDLFYRLNVFPVRVPPLRERPEDISLLVRHFAQQFARRMSKKIETIAAELLKSLQAYHWPGNIRELQNVIERAVILSMGTVLHVPLGELQSQSALAAATGSPADGKTELGAGKGIRDVLDDAERKHILAALMQTNWVVAGPNGAAAQLGMKRSTLQLRMRRLGISRELASSAS